MDIIFYEICKNFEMSVDPLKIPQILIPTEYIAAVMLVYV